MSVESHARREAPTFHYRRSQTAATGGGMEAAIGIIGGSGLYEIDGLGEVVERAVETPFGRPSDVLVGGRFGGRQRKTLGRHLARVAEAQRRKIAVFLMARSLRSRLGRRERGNPAQ